MTQNKRIIAITGGIGSGKSALLALLSSRGDIVSCDKINAELLQNAEYLERLKEAFPEAFTPEFNKRKLSEIIFFDENKRKKLNSIAHPRIMRKLTEEIEKCQRDVVFIEVPLLAGTGFDKLLSEIVVVTASDDVRQKRIEERDGVDSLTALKKMEGQKGEYLFPCAKVYAIENSGRMSDLKIACDRLLNQLSLN